MKSEIQANFTDKNNILTFIIKWFQFGGLINNIFRLVYILLFSIPL